jgi:flagellar FliJ protein
MARFRFRAAAALELRRKQESSAHAALARVEARFHELRLARESAVESRRAAQGDLASRERVGSDGATLEWHRTWIVHLSASVDRLGREIEAQARVVADARRAWLEARRRRRALERMRERAEERFRHAETLEENKALDELARLRFVMNESWRDDP